MKFALAIIAATAMGLSSAAAQGNKAGLYMHQDDQGAYRVFSDTDTQGSELLMNENGAAPSNCPAGAYYQTSDHFVRACGTDEQYGVAPMEGATMASGEAYPEGTWLLDREGVAFGGEDESEDKGVD